MFPCIAELVGVASTLHDLLRSRQSSCIRAAPYYVAQWKGNRGNFSTWPLADWATNHSAVDSTEHSVSPTGCHVTGVTVSARTFHGTPSEGLNALPQHMWVMRPITCLVILVRAALFGFQLLRSPPHSGKTSLLQLLQHTVNTVSVLRCGES